ncbi:MAG: SPFH domain-containing protein [Lachnospiraceae bacterium]|nr:SPFH domain-containing protein [Lachnospiraceae bacterium]
MIFIAILFVLLVVFIFTTINVVGQGHAYVIEWLGSYQTTWEHGLHIKIPIFQKIAKRVSLKEQVADFPPQPVITKDNVTIQIDTVVYYSIVDPKLFAYGAERPLVALENLTATTLRNIIGELELDETLTSRDTINGKMTNILDEATDPWGIRVHRVELKNIIPPRDIQESMEKQMRAEREKRQTLLEAEAHRQSIITRAEGDKQALVLKAEAERDAQIAKATGKAESIRLVYEAEAKGLEMLANANMNGNVLALKKLDALKELSNGQATKMIIPTDVLAATSDTFLKGEMFGEGYRDQINPSAAPAARKLADDDCCDSNERSAVTKEMVNSNYV